MSNGVSKSNQKISQKQALKKWGGELVRLLPHIEELLPRRAGDPLKFKRQLMMACVRNPRLLSCDRESLVLAALNCAELGLSCSGGPASRAHLVPFKTTVVCIPDYKGLIDIALDSGKVAAIDAETVHENDEFSYRRGTNAKLDHVPKMADRGELIAAYAIAWLIRSDRPIFAVMSLGELKEIRDGSQAYQYAVSKRDETTPWIKHFGQMCKKTTIRRIYNLLPTTPEMDRAVDIDGGASATRTLEGLGDIIDIGAGAETSDTDKRERGELLKRVAEHRIQSPDEHREVLEAEGFSVDVRPDTLDLDGLRILAEAIEGAAAATAGGAR